jgi:hypothetical protein
MDPRATRWSSISMVIGALMAAPCFVGILVGLVGLGALATSSLMVFFDTYRYIFMAIALVLLGLSHWGLRRAREFRPTKLVWIATTIVVVFIAAELILDPPWSRHVAALIVFFKL